MGDWTTGYSSGESVGSDKHFNILSTILEECTEDIVADDFDSSLDPSTVNDTSESDHDAFKACNKGAPFKAAKDRKSLKNNKHKKKVAFVLPTKKYTDWTSDAYYDGVSQFEHGDSNKAENYLHDKNASRSPKGLQDLSELDQLDNRSLKTLKTVFDILEMPELSAIFKGYESDCCDDGCQDAESNDKLEARKPRKTKKKGKNAKQKPKSSEKSKDIVKTLEHKCDHSKIMRNEDGTRVEVDHHFKNSRNPRLLSWLDQKNKAEKMRKREERKVKKQERSERKMQTLARNERKHLSDTLVKDWMLKKRKELRVRFSTRKVEPDRASFSSVEDKSHDVPLGYTLLDTFSSGGMSSDSSGPPSRICTSDSGISTTSIKSLESSFNSTANATPNKKGKPKKAKSTKSSESSNHSNPINSHFPNHTQPNHKSETYTKHFRLPPKSVWVDDEPVRKGLTHKKKEKLPKAKQGLKTKQIPIKPFKEEEFCIVKEETNTKKARKKSKLKENQYRPKIIKSTQKVNLLKEGKYAEKNAGINSIEPDILLKESRRRMSEKLSSKKKVSSWNNTKGTKKSDEKPQRESKYDSHSQESDSDHEVKFGGIFDESKQQNTLQGFDYGNTKDVNNEIREIPDPSVVPIFEKIASDSTKVQKLVNRDGSNCDKFKGSISPHASDADVESNEVDTDNYESELNDTGNESNSSSQPSEGSHRTKTVNNKQYQNKSSVPPVTHIAKEEKEIKKLAKTSVYDKNVQDRTTIKELPRKSNREFDDCLDFFLEDYHRPWMEL